MCDAGNRGRCRNAGEEASSSWSLTRVLGSNENISTRAARDPSPMRCYWRGSQLLVTKRAPL